MREFCLRKRLSKSLMQEFMQEFAGHLARPQGAADSNAPRIPPSPTWMLGCYEDWRVRGIGELGEGKELVRLEREGGNKSEAKLSRTW